MHIAILIINGVRDLRATIGFGDTEEEAVNDIAWVGPDGSLLNMWETEAFCKMHNMRMAIDVYESNASVRRERVSMEKLR